MRTAKKILVIAMSLAAIFTFGCSTEPPKKRHVAIFDKKKADERRKVQKAEEAREARIAEQQERDKRALKRLKRQQTKKRKQKTIEIARLEAEQIAAKRKIDAERIAAKRKIDAEEAQKTRLLGKHPYLAQLSPSWDSSALKYIAVDGERFTYNVIKEEIEDGNSIFHLDKRGQLFVNLSKKYEIEFGFHEIGTAGHDNFKVFEIEIIDRELQVVETKKILNRIDQHSFSR